jgi:hypothetical protein
VDFRLLKGWFSLSIETQFSLLSSSLSLHDGECPVKILDDYASPEVDLTAIACLGCPVEV